MTNLKVLKEKIEELSKFHQIEILRILQNAPSITLNENKNGIFVNLTNLDKTIVDKIEQYLLYVSKQESQLDVIENQKESLTNTFFKDNKDNIDSNVNYAPTED